MHCSKVLAILCALAVPVGLAGCGAPSDPEPTILIGVAPDESELDHRNAEPAAPPQVHRRAVDLPEMDSPQAILGARLFRENRMSNPGSQYLASCMSCHKPQDHPTGPRGYTDIEPRSLTPSIGDDMKGLTARNTPTLLDAALAERYFWNGKHASLEDAIREKLLGRHFGWLDDQRQQAIDEIHALVFNDTGVGTSNDGEPYGEAFHTAYGLDLSVASGEEVVDAVVAALAGYVRLLRTPETAPYDALAYLNRFGTRVEEGETPSDFSGRLFGRIANIEGRGQVKFPDGIGELEYQGFKIFMRAYPDPTAPGSVGNCVTCHHPPKFTDFDFHNTGVAQMEYDALHGEGAFARLAVPGPDAQRPNAPFGLPPDPDHPQRADLGYWNHIETDDADALARALGAFKTPPLRNLDLTNPYMHNGRYRTIEDALRQKIKASRMAQEGALVNPDPALLDMDLDEDDIAPLAAFLRALQEVDAEHFRDVVVENTRIRPANE